MTHAWLFTGPPGSGRSVAARAFAAALQCPDGGCGTCHACRTVLRRHPRRRATRRPGGAVDRRRRGARDRPRRRPRAVPGPLAGHARRGRRPAHRAGVQRGAQGDRGAAAAHGVPALRAEPAPRRRPGRPSARAAGVVGAAHAAGRGVADVLVRRDGVDPALAAWSRARPRRATSAGPGGWPATRRPGWRARRCSTSRCRWCRWRPASTPPPTWSTPPRRRPTRPPPALDGAETEARRRPASASAHAARAWPAASRAAPGGSRSWRSGRSRGPPGPAATRSTARWSTSPAFYRDVLRARSSAAGDRRAVHADRRADAADWPAGIGAEGALRRIDAVLACREAIEQNVKPLIAVEALTRGAAAAAPDPRPCADRPRGGVVGCPGTSAALAQSVEHLTRNEKVVGSIPTGGSHPARGSSFRTGPLVVSEGARVTPRGSPQPFSARPRGSSPRPYDRGRPSARRSMPTYSTDIGEYGCVRGRADPRPRPRRVGAGKARHDTHQAFPPLHRPRCSPALVLLTGCAGAAADEASRAGAVSIAIGEPMSPLVPGNTVEEYGTQILESLWTGLVEYDDGRRGQLHRRRGVHRVRGQRHLDRPLQDGWTFHDGTPVTAAVLRRRLELRRLQPQRAGRLLLLRQHRGLRRPAGPGRRRR